MMVPRCFAALAPLATVTLLLAAPVVVADVPSYNFFDLRARSNLCVNTGGAPVFNLPCDTFFNSATPTINEDGSVAIKLDVVSGSVGQGIFLSTGAPGSVVFVTAGDYSIGDMSINAAGDICFEQYFSSEDGLWIYDHVLGSAARKTTMPLGASGWGSPTLNDNDQIGYRANFAGSYAWVSYDIAGNSTAFHTTDASLDGASPYSFLFTPAFNNNRQIAGKVRLGLPGQTGNSRPDQIRVFNSDGSSVLIAEDADSNAGSPYSSFDNSVSLTNTGWVAFTASLVGGGRGVFLSDGTTTIPIATTADAAVSDVEFFPPAANDNGLVAFRGKDGTGLYAIFVGDGTTLRRVIGKGDPINTDLGPGQINQHDSSVVFGGAPAINQFGAVTFNAALTPIDDTQVEWGSGVIVAGIIGDTDGNLVVNVFDLLDLLSSWNTNGPGADFAAPFDVVDVFDLLALLSAWTT